MPSGSRGSSYVGHAELGDQLALLVLEVAALGVVAGLVEQPVDQRRRSASIPTALEVGGRPRRGRARRRPPVARSASSSSRRPDQVDDHAADRQLGAAQLVDAVGGLLHRHVLEHGDQVHGGPLRAQQRHHRVGLALDRADLGQPGELVVDVEELRDPAGRRRVEHHGVVLAGVLVARCCAARPRRPCRSAARRGRPGAIVVAKSMTPKRSSALPARPSR